MVRTILAVAMLAIAVGITGCTMCCHPYDQCGPVYPGHGRHATGCSRCARAGSILAPDAEATSMPAVVEEEMPTELSSQAEQVGDVPGSERIISVTERVVSPTPASTTAEPANLSVQTAKPLTPNAWTAKRTTEETVR